MPVTKLFLYTKYKRKKKTRVKKHYGHCNKYFLTRWWDMLKIHGPFPTSHLPVTTQDDDIRNVAVTCSWRSFVASISEDCLRILSLIMRRSVSRSRLFPSRITVGKGWRLYERTVGYSTFINAFKSRYMLIKGKHEQKIGLKMFEQIDIVMSPCRVTMWQSPIRYSRITLGASTILWDWKL